MENKIDIIDTVGVEVEEVAETEDAFDAQSVLTEKIGITNMSNEIKNTLDKMTSMVAGDCEEIMDNIVQKYTIEDITNMTDDEIDELLPVDVESSFKTKEEIITFKRDFINLNIESEGAMSKLDEELANIETVMQEHNEEIAEYMAQLNNPYDMLKDSLKTRLEKASTDKERETLEKANEYMGYVYNLKPLIDYVNTNKGRYVRTNFLSNKKSQSIYKKYLHVLGVHGITAQMEKRFLHLEKTYITETKYHEKLNLFIFIVISYIADMNKEDKQLYQSVYILGLYSVLSELYKGTLKDEDKEVLISSIKTVLDAVL